MTLLQSTSIRKLIYVCHNTVFTPRPSLPTFAFLLQIREALYQTIGYIVRNVGGFYACTQLQAQFVSAVTDNLDYLHSSHIRMLIRHVYIPLVKFCPIASRQDIFSYVITVLATLRQDAVRCC